MRTQNQNATHLPDGWIEDVAGPIAIAVAEKIGQQIQPTPQSPYLSVAEAAEYMRCKRQRIYDLLSARSIGRYKDGKRVLLRRDELDAYLASICPTQRAQGRPPRMP